VRIAVLHPQSPFTHGGAERHTEALVDALAAAGHEAEMVSIAGKWYPATELAHQMAVWRSFELNTAPDGQPVDAAIALKFPAYLARHDRKIVWLIHQRRSAYELWDHPAYGDLADQDEGPGVRELIWRADRVALGEAMRVFTNSRNVKDRLWNALQIRSEVLYHRSTTTDALLPTAPGPLGDVIVFPSRLEAIKRQALAVDAMRHVHTDVKLLLVGRGPDQSALQQQIDRHRLGDKVTIAADVDDARLCELYRQALGVYYGPFDEDYGYVTLEGMAAARPVVTLADAGGPLEFITDDETGLVAAPDARSIAKAFDELFRDRAGARELGARGKAVLTETVPAWPDVVATLLD
jgi:glycosyltransferase involved in cell wall biosynthesis